MLQNPVTNEIESDEAGNYRIEHLPPGIYTVYLSGINRQAATDNPTTVIAAENVTVHAGETTPLNLRAVVGWRLTVRAFDADTNRPVAGRPGVHIEGPSHPRSAGLGQSTALTEQGEWSFYVVPGHYRVFLTGPMAKGNPELASAEADVPADHAPEPVLLNVGVNGLETSQLWPGHPTPKMTQTRRPPVDGKPHAKPRETLEEGGKRSVATRDTRAIWLPMGSRSAGRGKGWSEAALGCVWVRWVREVSCGTQQV